MLRFHIAEYKFHNMKTRGAVMTENTSTKQSAGSQFSASDFVLNCSTLLTELPINERPAAARAAGFTEIEFWWPFDGKPVPTNQEVDAFIQAIQDAGVR